MKRVVLLSKDEFETIKDAIDDTIYYIKRKPMLSYEDCLVREKLEAAFKVLYSEDE